MANVPTPPGGAKYFLPMWRWANPTGNLHSNLGLGLSDQVQSAVISCAGVVLTASNFFWQVAAYLIAFVTDPQNNVAQNGSILGAVNNFVSTVGGALIQGPAPWLILSFAILAVAIGQLRGRVSMSGAVRCVVCLTLLTIMVSAAGSGHPDTTVGSPSWVIGKGTQYSDLLANGFSGTLNKVNQSFTPFSSGVPAPNCGQYIAALEQQAQNAGASPVQVGMSDLWDQAFLAQWTRVQFGVDGEGFKASCHYLDDQADPGTVGASNTVQWQIGQAAGYPAGTPAPQTGGVYGPWQDDDSLERGMIAWGWCDNNGNGGGPDGGWYTDPDFKPVEQSRNADGHECGEWWGQNAGGKPFDKQTNIIGSNDNNGVFSNHSFPPNDGYASTFVSWFDGHFTWTAVILAICALLAALGFGWLLGGIALIVLFAQVGLVVLLFLAPLLLLAMAWPGEAAARLPGTVGRVFGLCVIAKSIFLLLLAGLISLFELLDHLVAPNYGSTTSAIFIALVPLVAIFVARFVAKKLGVENILSPVGALKMASNVGQDLWKRSGRIGGGSGPGRSGGGGSRPAPGRPMASDDPARPRDRAGGRAAGATATMERIRSRAGADDDLQSPDKVEARKRAIAARAPDTSGPPGTVARARGFQVGPPRAIRPEERRTWNAGDGLNPPHSAEWNKTMTDRLHTKRSASGAIPLPAADSGSSGSGRPNQFRAPVVTPRRRERPPARAGDILTVYARDSRGDNGPTIRDPGPGG